MVRPIKVKSRPGTGSSQQGIGVYSLAAVVLLVRYTKQSEYLRACIARKIRGVVTVDQGDVRALLSGAKDDSANLEGEEPVEAPPIEVVETQATQQKEEEDDDADDPFGVEVLLAGRPECGSSLYSWKRLLLRGEAVGAHVEREKQAAKKRQHEEKKAKEKAARDEKLRKKDPVAADKKRAREEAKSEAKKKPRTTILHQVIGTVGIIIVPNAPTTLYLRFWSMRPICSNGTRLRHAGAETAAGRQEGAGRQGVSDARRRCRPVL